MADRRDVVEFIREVEKHECIYNTTIPDYSNRNLTKLAWGRIAEAMECSENDCKEKWRKIRIAFMRSLKQMKTSNKPYYLYDYLRFLLPYVNLKEAQPQEYEETVDVRYSPDFSDEEPISNKQRCNDSEDDHPKHNGHVVFVNDRIGERWQNDSFMHRQSQSIDECRKRKRTEDVKCYSNPRKMFLLSILPDVESFTEEEMRTFRRTVVSSIDSIMDARKEMNGKL